MPFFGQVWVWSLAGFLVGALLCWILIANPARKRVADLQSRLAAARKRETAAATSVAEAREDYRDEYTRAAYPPVAAYQDDRDDFARDDFARDDYRDDVDHADEPRDFPETALVPGFDSADHEAQPAQDIHDVHDDADDHAADVDDDFDRTRFAQPVDEPEFDQAEFAAEHARFDEADHYDDTPADDDADERGALSLGGHVDPPSEVESTQYIPAARLPEQSIADQTPADWFAGPVDEPADNLVDDLDDIEEPQSDAVEPEQADEPAAEVDTPLTGTIFTQHTTPIPAELIRQIDEREPDGALSGALIDDFDDAPIAEPEPTQRVDATPALAAIDSATEFVRHPEPEPVVVQAVEPEQAYQPPLGATPLPKRVPAKPGGRFPFGIQTTPAPEPSAPVATATPDTDRERSLFEPVRNAGEADATKVVAPARSRRSRAAVMQAPSGGVDPFVAPGPFGPGSAMPLPGGASPSGDYTVKASVTALRYCSPESPRFDRTIAEVWFRSVADAERVGFRPLG